MAFWRLSKFKFYISIYLDLYIIHTLHTCIWISTSLNSMVQFLSLANLTYLITLSSWGYSLFLTSQKSLSLGFHPILLVADSLSLLGLWSSSLHLSWLPKAIYRLNNSQHYFSPESQTHITHCLLKISNYRLGILKCNLSKREHLAFCPYWSPNFSPSP